MFGKSNKLSKLNLTDLRYIHEILTLKYKDSLPSEDLHDRIYTNRRKDNLDKVTEEINNRINKIDFDN